MQSWKEKKVAQNLPASLTQLEIDSFWFVNFFSFRVDRFFFILRHLSPSLSLHNFFFIMFISFFPSALFAHIWFYLILQFIILMMFFAFILWFESIFYLSLSKIQYRTKMWIDLVSCVLAVVITPVPEVATQTDKPDCFSRWKQARLARCVIIKSN